MGYGFGAGLTFCIRRSDSDADVNRACRANGHCPLQDGLEYRNERQIKRERMIGGTSVPGIRKIEI